ncbi:HmuY family protein [Xanthomarina sp. GH4-25]|uniref:HmuY family protein n=1 Tax=Xanthomarina sp. GH4-25 TaxID=3349335 RepID=UPI000D682A8D|nr:hypothetical protein DI383_03705 [Flavobacteriaceae bacterium LYZ1037]
MTNKFLSILFGILLITTFSCSNDDDSSSGPISVIVEGASVTPEVGGPNQQNQVYIDLSTNTSTKVVRDSWDLGFYSGSEFRVVINGSIAMAVAELSTTDIDAVDSNDTEVLNLQPEVAVGTFNNSNLAYVDAFDGNILETAINEISDIDSENKVYLLNLGKEVGTETPANGSVDLGEIKRGWMKIRVLKDGDSYVLQYADLDDTTHQEITISKSIGFNFTFFSFNTGAEVNVEPNKLLWDLNFTVFTDEVFAGPDSYGAYFYGDFVSNNTKGNVGVYKIDTTVNTELSYDNFTLANVVDANLIYNDQRIIGSSWRNGGGPGSQPSLKDNVFYVVNDTDGNLYKLKFLALTNNEGERGHPEFVYSLLQ